MCEQQTAYDLRVARDQAEKLRERRQLNLKYQLDQYFEEERKRSIAGRLRSFLTATLHRLVGPSDGGNHPAHWQRAPGGSSVPEGASDVGDAPGRRETFFDLEAAIQYTAEQRLRIAKKSAHLGNVTSGTSQKRGGQIIAAPDRRRNLDLKGINRLFSASFQKQIDSRNVAHKDSFKFVQLVFNKFKSFFHAIHSEILCRLVGPSDGGGHPAQTQEENQSAPGGSITSEDASNA
ncbi:hypothetical protein [Thalassovita sp.]|uniref:hypothetical protein n=1 Tax=Thalassovita sp. TaxID=1979401 RepID=UPI0028818762|nr:hypothetical protein [Thalassovita sp.]MDF1802465.1 hypothetical protein [Thalassovita sp.]